MSNENVKEELLEEVETNHEVEAEGRPITENPDDEATKATNPLDDIAYFVIFPQNTKVLDDALALITNEALPREDAKVAVLKAINSVLVPVTKEQLEEAQAQAGGLNKQAEAPE